MSIKVETSGFCHSERSEESVNNVTFAVHYPLFIFPCRDRGIEILHFAQDDRAAGRFAPTLLRRARGPCFKTHGPGSLATLGLPDHAD